jgi:TRAP-type C4-dicarboxylate transport system permease small subunit
MSAKLKMSSKNLNTPEKNSAEEIQKDSKIEKEPSQESASSLSLLQTIISIFAAVFGVQSVDKHQRDFEKGDPTNFILAGIIFVILFIGTVFFIVSVILDQAGVS